jgi:hypothetical protein
MAINGYVSSKAVMAKLYRDLGLTTEINESHVIEWIAEALELIGTFYQYDEISTNLPIVDGKIKLPPNFYKLITITYINGVLSWANANQIPEFGCETNILPRCCTENKFYINNSYIITDITESQIKQQDYICISYLGVPVDDEGYPLIPDDVHFMKACSSYVTYMIDYRDWRKGNTADKVMQKSEQEWLWYVAAAKGSANMPNLAQLNSLKNVMVRLIPSQNAYTTNFRNINNVENLKRH